MKLSDLMPFFQGVYPSTFYTCSADGIPNVNYLSQVYFVDEDHVAISAQFLNKTRKNLEQNKLASLMLIHPVDTCHVELFLVWKKSETSGKIFDHVNDRIEAIHSQVGGELKWKLASVEIFQVTDIQVPPEYQLNLERKQLEKFSLANLQTAITQIQGAKNLEDLYDRMLEVLETSFGFAHSMLLVPEGKTDRLITINTRGYEDTGVGAEVVIGEGIIGHVAKTKRPIAFMGYKREIIYAKTSQMEIQSSHREASFLNAIQLPSLPEAWSQIALPLLSRNELMGVLRVESLERFDFRYSDEEFLMAFGSYMAVIMENFQLQQEPEYAVVQRQQNLTRTSHTKKIHLTYYKEDECLFLDGEYFIRNIPAKIFWKILSLYQNKGQIEFTNRELRLDSALCLQEYKDNLETRLILLRKRLEKKCSLIELVSVGRGKFKIVINAQLELEEI